MTSVLRLRPVAHAVPVPGGVHIRGWAGTSVVEGGDGLWAVWSALSRALAEGLPPARLDAWCAAPRVGPAVTLFIAELRRLDLLVELPDTWDDTDRTARWLESVAADPPAALHRLRTTPVTVTGRGLVADACAAALTDAGMPTAVTSTAEDGVTLTAGGFVVMARVPGETGFVTFAGTAARVAAHAGRIAARLAVAPAPVPVALAGLVGGAAAHRLACAVAGMADPGGGGMFPMVFVAGLDPLHGNYHPWPAAGPPPPSDGGLAGALGRAAALGDRRLGALPVPQPVDAPMPLAVCRVGGRLVAGTGTGVDAARLDCAAAAAEARLGHPAGFDRRHADGRWLRLAVRWAWPGAGDVLPANAWAERAGPRRWWKALTLGYGQPAALTLRRLPGPVHLAEVTAAGVCLGWAVEAGADDAAAYAVLAAAAVAHLRHLGADIGPDELRPGAAVPGSAARSGEAAFQAVLRELVRCPAGGPR